MSTGSFTYIKDGETGQDAVSVIDELTVLFKEVVIVQYFGI